MSKKTAFMTAYAALSAKGPLPARKEVLATLAAEVGVSTACASTYLSNVATGKWVEGEVKAPKAKKERKPKAVKMTLESIGAMNGPALVAAYNAKAPKAIAKFRDHATGVRRVAELYGVKS